MKRHLVEHVIKGHKIVLCLQCDHDIEDKSVIIMDDFDMREFVRKQFEDLGVKLDRADLDRMVKS